jgi:fructose-1,6-bisphosphatase/inositol monophosphatase family enzyme
VDDASIIAVGLEAARAVRLALDGLRDWGPSGHRVGQYRSDVVADDAAVSILVDAGFGVVSEESGEHYTDRAVVAVVDPVDGSTNASQGVPWFATSICFIDDAGPRASVVVNQASGVVFEAIRGGGARRDGHTIAPSTTYSMGEAIVGISGWPPAHLGWQQFRALGAAALDISAVACGMLDAYVDCSDNGHSPWDYLGALLICEEAGAVVDDAFGQPLVTLEHGARRTPVAAATPPLLDAALAVRRRLPRPSPDQ